MSGQLALFELPPLPAAPPAIWERVAGIYGKIGTVHIHRPSGWEIHHCGHPTANYPYYILKPDGTPQYAPNGRGFIRLDVAKKFTEDNT